MVGKVIVNAGSLKHDPGFLSVDFSARSVAFYVFSASGIDLEKTVAL